MFLKTSSLKGFKNFGDEFTIEFNDGLNLLIGENGVGKSAIVDAVRLLLPKCPATKAVSKALCDEQPNSFTNRTVWPHYIG